MSKEEEEEEHLVAKERFASLARKYGFGKDCEDPKCASLFNKIVRKALKQSLAVAMLDVEKKKKRERHVARENMPVVRKRMRMYLWTEGGEEEEDGKE